VVLSLIALYDRLGDAKQKQQVVAVLAHIDTDPAVEKLAAIAAHDPEGSIRQDAIDGLEHSHNSHAPALLAKVAAP
jgi:hypothetical protein